MEYIQDKTLGISLPLPEFEIETPCFIILESALENNLKKTAALAGGVHRLAPHVKTHRSPWVTKYLIKNGVKAFKCATTREVEMVLECGAAEAIWAYPTTNPAAIARVIKAAAKFPNAKVSGMVDTQAGLDTWLDLFQEYPDSQVALRIDLDPGLKRTGVPIDDVALDLALKIAEAGRFGGWHMYDGHIKDLDLDVREANVLKNKVALDTLFEKAIKHGLTLDLVAGGSYTYPIWASHTDAKVSPGSWAYSSCQHFVDLKDQEWQVAAYVLTTALSQRNGTTTLDAGSKAICPDILMNKRYTGVDEILNVNEEHSVVVAPDVAVGDKVALVPRHACTTAYLYRRALVLNAKNEWEYQDQLGCER